MESTGLCTHWICECVCRGVRRRRSQGWLRNKCKGRWHICKSPQSEEALGEEGRGGAEGSETGGRSLEHGEGRNRTGQVAVWKPRPQLRARPWLHLFSLFPPTPNNSSHPRGRREVVFESSGIPAGSAA